MNTATKAYLRSKGYIPDTVLAARDKHREECQLRLARIMNNAEPSHKNGHPKAEEKGIKG